MKNRTSLSIILAILVASVFSLAYGEYSSTKVDTIQFHGPLSQIYIGEDSRFFEGTDTVHASFVGELTNGKMVNGFAEVRSTKDHVTYLGGIVDGVMLDEDAEMTWIRPDSSIDFYRGKFNGYDFDSCFYASSRSSILYVGKMLDGEFHDENATYIGPLDKIYNGDITPFTTTNSQFLNYTTVHFDNNDMATYRGSIRYGKLDGIGELAVSHDNDTLYYNGEFENAQMHGIGFLKVDRFYSYTGHFVNGQIRGMGEITSSNFSSFFTDSELIPERDGVLSIKGIWNGIETLHEYFRVSAENGNNVKLRVTSDGIKELNLFQSIGGKIGNTWFAEKLEMYDSELQKYITGATILNAGVCASVFIPQAAPVSGPLCGIGFVSITGLEAAKLTILTFRNIDRQCYTDNCVEETWTHYGKEQLVNAAFLALPFGVGKVGKIAAPAVKDLINATKMSRYAKAIASSKNAKAVEELEKLPKIHMERAAEIDMVNDRLAFKQAVLDYTGKNFRDGFVEFFIRLKKSGREDLIKDLWNNHKNYIKNSGIRAGGVHEWLKAENFVDFLLNPKWGKDGAYLAYMLPRATQPTMNVVLKNGGAHTIIDAAGRKIPGPNSGSFHRSLGEKIEVCNNASCVFNNMKDYAEKVLARESYGEYLYMERAILQ